MGYVVSSRLKLSFELRNGLEIQGNTGFLSPGIWYHWSTSSWCKWLVWGFNLASTETMESRFSSLHKAALALTHFHNTGGSGEVHYLSLGHWVSISAFLKSNISSSRKQTCFSISVYTFRESETTHAQALFLWNRELNSVFWWCSHGIFLVVFVHWNCSYVAICDCKSDLRPQPSGSLGVCLDRLWHVLFLVWLRSSGSAKS